MALLDSITKWNYYKTFKSPFIPAYDGWYNARATVALSANFSILFTITG